MKYCTGCGEPLEAEDRYCGECGTPVRTTASVGGTSEQRRRVFGDGPPPATARSETTEQWERVFGDHGPGEDVPPTAHRHSIVGAIALALGVATPLLALVLNSVGFAVLFIGGVLTAVAGGAGMSDAGDDVADRTVRNLAAAGLVLGLAWIVIAVIVPLVR